MMKKNRDRYDKIYSLIHEYIVEAYVSHDLPMILEAMHKAGRVSFTPRRIVTPLRGRITSKLIETKKSEKFKKKKNGMLARTTISSRFAIHWAYQYRESFVNLFGWVAREPAASPQQHWLYILRVGTAEEYKRLISSSGYILLLGCVVWVSMRENSVCFSHPGFILLLSRWKVRVSSFLVQRSHAGCSHRLWL